ncbi:NmrA family NAD(P)-binding protein [Pontibacter sp. H249]|uniref:NmrA family NAD(P)-binding protein n=1 Tax=Pontibacter sp. H249 TaxID=3133420 RepID=UPI0030BCD45B
MQNILITGATGNVGIEVIKSLSKMQGAYRVVAGLREAKSDNSLFRQLDTHTTYFNFADEYSIKKAFQGCDIIFLLRPPQLSDVEKYFAPLVKIAIAERVKHIVFLSVQGAETSSLIPHHKIEKLIVQSGINYTFLRPAYFMQNFTTTLKHDLVYKNRICLPAGEAKFNLIDVADVGLVAAHILASPEAHINKAYDLTNKEQLNFREMAYILSHVLERNTAYISPNLLSFYISKIQEGISSQYILVMIMLHFLPRFQKPPQLSDWVEKLTSKKPSSFVEFVEKHKDLLQPHL